MSHPQSQTFEKIKGFCHLPTTLTGESEVEAPTVLSRCNISTKPCHHFLKIDSSTESLPSLNSLVSEYVETEKGKRDLRTSCALSNLLAIPDPSLPRRGNKFRLKPRPSHDDLRDNHAYVSKKRRIDSFVSLEHHALEESDSNGASKLSSNSGNSVHKKGSVFSPIGECDKMGSPELRPFRFSKPEAMRRPSATTTVASPGNTYRSRHMFASGSSAFVTPDLSNDTKEK